jgi:hypothetical protein
MEQKKSPKGFRFDDENDFSNLFDRLLKNVQVQVEPCEIPLAGAPPSAGSG